MTEKRVSSGEKVGALCYKVLKCVVYVRFLLILQSIHEKDIFHIIAIDIIVFCNTDDG